MLQVFFSRLSLKKVLEADESEDEEVKHGEELNTRFEKRSHSGNITIVYRIVGDTHNDP